VTHFDLDAVRRAFGSIGTYPPLGFTGAVPVAVQQEAVASLDGAGFQAVWTNEVIGGRDVLVHLGVLLAAAQRAAVGTGIANIWARAPQTLHAGAAMLAQAYPDRLLLGVGVGYPQQAATVGRDFGRPLQTMRDYLRRMDEPTWRPAPEVGYPRIVGAIGPKMLTLAGQVADGAMCAGLPPQFTARARQLLGADKLLVVGLPVVLVDDHDQARGAARALVEANLGRASYTASLAEVGLRDEPSDRLVDAVVGFGGAGQIAARVREHLAAGADHVVVMPPVDTEFESGLDHLLALAPALREVATGVRC
jgi:probable F420-dependent oxidoreductase